MAQVSQEVEVKLLPGTMGSSEDSTSKWGVGRTYAFSLTWLLTNISPSPLGPFHRDASWWYSWFPPEWANQEKSRENAQRGGHSLFITYSLSDMTSQHFCRILFFRDNKPCSYSRGNDYTKVWIPRCISHWCIFQRPSTTYRKWKKEDFQHSIPRALHMGGAH